ncbi:MAG TPA: cation:proton antiporter, partial [bacterium]|nr:cation:proton antiporter [bacterium]
VIATLVAWLFGKWRLPPILGFLLAGFIIGPNGLSLITHDDSIRQIAELGVILLMLTIGLEFNFSRLRGLRRVGFMGGTLQILLSIGIAILFALWKGWTLYQGFLLGAVIALSSTAIVLKYLIDKGQLDSAQGRIAVAILIFQDLAVVPLMILVVGLGQSSAVVSYALITALAKVILLLAGVLLFTKFLLPRFLHEMAATRNREIFFLTAVVLCFGTAWVSQELGLSLAIGAFFAGIMFANTDYGHQLSGDIVPFRHIFVNIFFVSLGLLFDLRFTVENFPLILTVVGLVLLVNCVVTSIVILACGYPPRVALASGIILAQIGEFSFLLLETGRKTGQMDPFLYQVLLSTAFLTMFLTPFLFASVPLVLRVFESVPFFGVAPSEWKKKEKTAEDLEGHIILCGLGPTGQDLALTFEKENLPFVIVEMNPKRIQAARHHNWKVLYGDAANEEVMKRVGILQAKVVVISFGDPIGMTQIIRTVQRLNREVLLIVRTRFEKDVPWLYELGADVVVMEELEASFELHRLVLDQFKIPAGRITEHLERIRGRKELLVEEAILKKMQTGKK